MEQPRRAPVLSLDQLPGLGNFIEIEGKGNEVDEEAVLARIDSLRHQLRIEPGQESRPYSELMLHRLESEPEFREEHAQLVQRLIESEM
jgi:hypothetical protein